MTKKLIPFLIISILIFTSCSSGEKKEEKTNSTLVSKSLKYQLVNITDEIIDLLEKKDYIKCYDELMDFHEKANEVGIYYITENDKNALDFKFIINELTKNISEEADKQKIQKVAIDVEKSKIKILTEMTKSKSDEGKEKSGNGDSSKSSGGDEEKESKSNGKESGEDKKGEESEIVLPQEELLKKYPELLINDTDLEIQNKASELYKYCGYVLNLEEKDKKAGLIKLKYYLYKITTLAKLDRYDEINEYYTNLTSEWKFEFNNAQKTSEKDAKIINSIVENLSSQLEEKNIPVIDMNTKIAVESINNLIDKTI
ncbi:MAG: hypothetical protein N4A50_08485 [Vallitalea sp.]|jgi:hypothetical protein|nr:hypothetical protein [Vallitalea sp.]